ncbi:hypothetical protein F0562_034479 [Nyssa sinensis]|uniref:cyclin-dependent kinase n=1 Tax=Nyssa sinensis TaxID=561372 RepID=A0A5J5AKA2_9ASTE|nr:hypothetical protein F0562_034479 [Nyssa sinensis]
MSTALSLCGRNLVGFLSIACFNLADPQILLGFLSVASIDFLKGGAVLLIEMDKYKKTREIGYGGFGNVYQGCNRVTNENVTLKELWFPDEKEGVPSVVIKEISLLKEMEHSNIVRLLEVVSAVNENSVYLVYEDMECDLQKFMNDCPKIAKDPDFIKRFLQQILCGLAYYHSHNILHQDLKPQNMWIDRFDYILKLADFGWARAFGGSFKKIGYLDVTHWYKAPELLRCQQFSTPVDVWSVGCIFAEMVTRRPLFAEFSEVHQLLKIFSILGTPTWPEGTTSHLFANCYSKDLAAAVPGLVTLEPAGIDLLSKMLCINPSGRITAHDALKHAYFDNIEFEV